MRLLTLANISEALGMGKISGERLKQAKGYRQEMMFWLQATSFFFIIIMAAPKYKQRFFLSGKNTK